MFSELTSLQFTGLGGTFSWSYAERESPHTSLLSKIGLKSKSWKSETQKARNIDHPAGKAWCLGQPDAIPFEVFSEGFFLICPYMSHFALWKVTITHSPPIVLGCWRLKLKFDRIFTFLVLVVFLACLPQTLLQRHCIHCSLKVQLRRSHLHQNFAMMIQLLEKIIFLFLHIHSTCQYIMILLKDFVMFSNIKRPPNDEVFQPDKYRWVSQPLNAHRWPRRKFPLTISMQYQADKY